MISSSGCVTWFDWVDPPGEYNDGETRVDEAGYVPLKDALERYIRSGELLDDITHLHFHSDMIKNLENVDYEDPMMYRGMDKVDLELWHKAEIEAILKGNADLAKAVKTSEDKKQSDVTVQSEEAGTVQKAETAEATKETTTK